ncbi:MAG: hypothetical protein QHH06_08020 [Clostridiales bacterium]|nr:hypothetical protein [Eubacteriales bacterium]MDH7566412.1 hypothetical protein [Clostridiales bacterium]
MLTYTVAVITIVVLTSAVLAFMLHKKAVLSINVLLAVMIGAAAVAAAGLTYPFFLGLSLSLHIGVPFIVTVTILIYIIFLLLVTTFVSTLVTDRGMGEASKKGGDIADNLLQPACEAEEAQGTPVYEEPADLEIVYMDGNSTAKISDEDEPENKNIPDERQAEGTGGCTGEDTADGQRYGGAIQEGEKEENAGEVLPERPGMDENEDMDEDKETESGEEGNRAESEGKNGEDFELMSQKETFTDEFETDDIQEDIPFGLREKEDSSPTEAAPPTADEEEAADEVEEVNEEPGTAFMEDGDTEDSSGDDMEACGVVGEMDIEGYIDEAFRLKQEGDFEGAILYYMYALDMKPEDGLAFWIVLDLCVLYKNLGQVELAKDILESYRNVYSNMMDETIKVEIEKNLL